MVEVKVKILIKVRYFRTVTVAVHNVAQEVFPIVLQFVFNIRQLRIEIIALLPLSFVQAMEILGNQITCG